MSEVIKRTRISLANPLHLERDLRADTPQFFPPFSSDWIMTKGPSGFPTDDLSGVTGVDPRYWETVGDTVVAMDQAGKDAVDAKVLADHNVAVETRIKTRGIVPPALSGEVWTAIESGLTVTVNIDTVVVNDVTTVVTDASLTKFLKIMYIHNTTTDALTVEAFEHTDGNYDALALNEIVKGTLWEGSVVANGTDLVKD